MSTFPTQAFFKDNQKITGEVVAETALAWMVVVAGEVTVLPKQEWIGVPIFGDFTDLFNAFGGRP